jgi:putative nucleotidyltransferase with HDIG domain
MRSGEAMTRNGVVLIVTDRPDEAEPLARSIRMVVDCTLMSPRGTLPQGPVAAVVLDVDARTTLPGSGPLARLLASDAPLLFLGRAQDAAEAARARALGARAVVPATLSRTAVVATLLKLIDLGGTRRPSTSRVRAVARAAEAGRVVTGILDDAAADRPVSADAVDAGTEIVVEAIEDAGIRAWLEVVWAHDDHLYQHALSVTGYAAAFAGALGFPAADRLRLAKAALLHDLGKTKIPRSILNKPGRLDAMETTIMRAHPVIGARILEGQPGFDADMIDVVRHHHEMLDGSGYPDGLMGSQITDLVRLVTICDIYSALTERRPYRAPMAGHAAYAHLEGMAGKVDMALLRAYRPVSERAAVPSDET